MCNTIYHDESPTGADQIICWASPAANCACLCKSPVGLCWRELAATPYCTTQGSREPLASAATESALPIGYACMTSQGSACDGASTLPAQARFGALRKLHSDATDSSLRP